MSTDQNEIVNGESDNLVVPQDANGVSILNFHLPVEIT